jgi:hypothetical protein
MVDLPLKGARIWLSCSLSPEADGDAVANFKAFVRDLAGRVFAGGGTIIHGSHPSIVPTLLEAAEEHQKNRGKRDALLLAASKSEYEKYKNDLARWQELGIVHEEPAVPNDRERSLARLRVWVAAGAAQPRRYIEHRHNFGADSGCPTQRSLRRLAQGRTHHQSLDVRARAGDHGPRSQSGGAGADVARRPDDRARYGEPRQYRTHSGPGRFWPACGPNRDTFADVKARFLNGIKAEKWK